MKPRALLIEDTAEFAWMASRVLEDSGYQVEVCSTGEDGVHAAKSSDIELAVVDIGLPGIDGFEVCRRIREFSDAYLIIVTARSSDVEKVVGFRIGADDYVVKPYSPDELAARIAAMKRRPRASVVVPEPVRVFGDLSIDVSAREATLGGEPLELTRTEFDVLAALSSSPRRAQTRTQLVSHIWGSTEFLASHVLDVHVGNLRKKLGETADRPRYISTVRGVGFRFDGGED